MKSIEDRLSEAGKDIDWLKQQFDSRDLVGDTIQSVHLPIDPRGDSDPMIVHLVYIAGRDKARLFADMDLAKAYMKLGKGHDLSPEVRYKYKESDTGIPVEI